MSGKLKFSKEIILITIEQYKKGIKSMAQLSAELDVSLTTISHWIRNYESIGITSLDCKPRNNSYSSYFKSIVIQSYLNDEGSHRDLAKKYQISSHRVINNWGSKYNRDIEIKDYNPKGYVLSG